MTKVAFFRCLHTKQIAKYYYAHTYTYTQIDRYQWYAKRWSMIVVHLRDGHLLAWILAIQLEKFHMSMLDARRIRKHTHKILTQKAYATTHLHSKHSSKSTASPFSSCKFCKSKVAQSFADNKNLNSLTLLSIPAHLSWGSIPFEHPRNQLC